MEQAEQLFSKLVASDPRNVNAGLMLGQCYLESRKRREAKRSFERVLKDIDSHDVYALCQVGNLYIKFAQGDPKQVSREFPFYLFSGTFTLGGRLSFLTRPSSLTIATIVRPLELPFVLPKTARLK